MYHLNSISILHTDTRKQVVCPWCVKGKVSAAPLNCIFLKCGNGKDPNSEEVVFSGLPIWLLGHRTYGNSGRAFFSLMKQGPTAVFHQKCTIAISAIVFFT